MPKHLSLDPLPRTLAYLDSHGWMADEVERRERYATYDLFGCYDVLAFSTHGQPIVVQCTSDHNVPARLAKCIANLNSRRLVQRGVWCEVWGWLETRATPRRTALVLDGRGLVAAPAPQLIVLGEAGLPRRAPPPANGA